MTSSRTRRDHRHRSREAALQALYHVEIGQTDIDDALGAVWSLEATPARARAFADRLARGATAHVVDIDPLIAASGAHWRLSRMAVIDRLILRLAVYELLYAADTPRAVVINEALELARTFSADEAVAFINGVLDDIRRRLDAGDVTVVAAPHGGEDERQP